MNKFDFSKIKSDNSFITKEDILDKVTEKDIFEYYLKINIKYNALISSPFRKDNNPSFGLRVSGNTVTAKDFASGESYDCFSLVQKLYNCTYSESLKIISTDFNLVNNINYRRTKISEVLNIPRQSQTVVKSNILIQKQPFTPTDILYWKQYGITLDVLAKFDVFSCKQVYIGNNVFKQYKLNDPIYAYDFGDCYKIYSPNDSNKKNKWRFSGTSDTIEGCDNLFSIIPAGGLPQVLVITKSLKDVMCLYVCGISAISLSGESTNLKTSTYNFIKSKFNTIVSLYDNDEAGVKGANKLYQQYDIKSLFIPVESGCKDFAEYVKMYGKDKAKELIDTLLNN